MPVNPQRAGNLDFTGETAATGMSAPASRASGWPAFVANCHVPMCPRDASILKPTLLDPGASESTIGLHVESLRSKKPDELAAGVCTHRRVSSAIERAVVHPASAVSLTTL